MTGVDFRRERDRFPTFIDRTYFASQSLGPFPSSMLADLREYGLSLSLRNRGIRLWAERFEELLGLTEQLIEAPKNSVFFRDSATAIQATIAASLVPRGARRRIVVSTSDFHSSRYLWAAQASRGFEIVEVESMGSAHSLEETFLPFIDERVAVVALSLVSPRAGALLPVAKIASAARRAGAISVIDAFQAMGVVPVRVAEMGADVVVGGFHKWVGGGGTGLAFGQIAPALSGDLDCMFPGWIGHANIMGFSSTYEPAPGARKFQQGMPAVEPLYTSRAGIQWILETGIDAIRSRSIALVERVHDRAVERGLKVISPASSSQRGGMVCVEILDGMKAVERLAAQSIDVDFRPGAGVRIGPHVCCTEDECDRVVDALAEAIR